MNKFEKVAELLGKKLNENFKLDGLEETFFFTYDGLETVEDTSIYYRYDVLDNLLKGEYGVSKNHYEEVANLFGLGLGEEFTVFFGIEGTKMKFTKRGLRSADIGDYGNLIEVLVDLLKSTLEKV